MKKRLTAGISLILALVFVFTLISCGGMTAKRKFVGVISEKAYFSQEEAIIAYLQNEYCVESDGMYDLVSYDTVENLTLGELSSLGVTNSDAVRGEKVSVVFKNRDGEEYETEVYLLEEDEKFKYCSIEPWEDTPLNKAYFDFISEESQYNNVTVTLKTSLVYTYEGYRATTQTELKVYYTQGGTYVSYEKTDFSVGESHSQFIEFWVVKEEKTKVYTNDEEGVFVEITEDVLPILNDSVENITPISFLRKYSHTIFMNGDNEFYLKEEAKEPLKTQFLQDVFGNTDGEVNAINIDVEIEDGKVLSIFKTANATYGEITLFTVSTAVYANYGKTEVNIPEEIYEMQEQSNE